MQNTPFLEDGFYGLEAGTSRVNIPPRYVARADNVYLQGVTAEGATLATRPGKRGTLTSFIEPIWEKLPYQKADGSQVGLFVAGSGSDTAGKVYTWPKGATSATHLSGLGAFQETKTMFARLGVWVFACGNVDTFLRRYNPETGTTEGATGISTPTYRAAIRTANRPYYNAQVTPLPIFGTPGEWAADTIASGSLTVVDPSFVAGSLTGITAPNDLSPNAWQVASGIVECSANIDSASPATKYVRLDEPNSAIITDAAAIMTNATKSNANGTGGTRYGMHFRVDCRMKNDVATESVIFSLVACDNSGTELARVTQTLSALGNNSIADRSLYLSLASVIDDSLPVKLKLQLTAGPDNQPGTVGPYVTNIALTAIEPTVGVTQAGSGVSMSAYYLSGIYSQDSATIYLGQTRLAYDLNSTVNFSASTKFAIPFRPLVDLTAFTVRLGIREGLTDPPAYSDPLVLVEDADGTMYLTGDFSVFTDADINAALYVDLLFSTDIPLVSPSANTGQALFTLGPLLEAGGLSSGATGAAPYEYLFVEKRAAAGSLQFVVSGGGPVTDAITPTAYQASAELTLPAGTYPEDADADRLMPYRRGGLIGDRYFRKIAEFDPTIDAVGAFWTWDASTLTFTDRTPDTALQAAEDGATVVSDPDFFFSDHQGAPASIIALAAHDGRLLALTTSELWISQLTSIPNAQGLYWNNVVNQDSNTLATDGWYTRVSGNDGGNAGAATPRIFRLFDQNVLFYQTTKFFLGGNNAGDYYLREWEGERGYGLIAPMAGIVAANAIWYLSQDGLRAMDLKGDYRVSGAIDNLLSPKTLFQGPALNPAAYKRASLASDGERLYLSVPGEGSTTIDRTYVLDLRWQPPPQGRGAWSTWYMGQISGALTFRGDGDQNDLYLTGANLTATQGQLFGIGYAFGDRELPSHNSTAVLFDVETRSYRQPGWELRAERLYATVEGPIGGTLTWVAYANRGMSDEAAATGTYDQSGAIVDLSRVDIPAFITGREVSLRLRAASTETQVQLVRIGLTASDARQRA